MCIGPYKEYIYVAFSGMLSVAIISSIYSFLTNVQTVRVMPDTNSGIHCWSNIGDVSDDYCDHVAELMDDAVNGAFGNNVTNTTIIFETTMFLDITSTIIVPLSDWQCAAYTDYTNKTIYDTFTSFKDYLIALITFTVLYGIFAIIHDWTLIYYKENLEIVTFLPESFDQFYLTHFWNNSRKKLAICNPFDKLINNNWNICIKICTIIIIYILLLPFIIIATFSWGFMFITDYVLIHTFWPIVYMIGSVLGKTQSYQIPTICHISAEWVGITRFLMSVATFVLLVFSSDGFSNNITSLDPDNCSCECIYIMQEFDYYKLLLTTSVFIGLNIKFLLDWTKETIHGNYHLYLVTYKLPIKTAHTINSDECTGSMMKDVSVIQLNEKFVRMQIMANDKHYLMENDGVESDEEKAVKQNEEKLVDETVKEKMNKMAVFVLRVGLLVFSVIYYLLFGASVMWTTVDINYYQYPKWLQTLCYVFVAIAIIAAVIAEFALLKYLTNIYNDKKRKTQT